MVEKEVPPDPKSSEPIEPGYQGFISALLSRREQYFTEVVRGVDLPRKLGYSIWTLLGLAAFYGLLVGFYCSLPQAVAAAIKLPLLFLATFVICFPAFYVVQILVGSRLRLLQVLVLVLSTLALTTILLAAFVPIIAFFLITGSNYYFLQLLHIVVVLVAGLLGMYVLHDGLTHVCEQHGVYPRKAMTIMRPLGLCRDPDGLEPPSLPGRSRPAVPGVSQL